MVGKGQKGGIFMYNFEYVTQKELQPVKRELIELIEQAKEKLRDEVAFNYSFVGSSARNMVTQDIKSNCGFDFDVNLKVKDGDPKYIRNRIMRAFDEVINEINNKRKWQMTNTLFKTDFPLYGYDNCENGTRVFTIKAKDTEHSRIIHSCDFAIVKNNHKNGEMYIRFNKNTHSYTWEMQSAGFKNLSAKEEFCKDNQLWTEVRELYLEKKNLNTDKNKKSRSIYAETVHEICQENGYFR